MSKNDYQKFIEQKHASFVTPQNIWEKAIVDHLNAHVKSATRLLIGESNEVYDVKVSEGQELIVRISHSKKPEFYREKWALNECLNLGVPVPSVLLVEDISYDDNTRTLCVESKLTGEILSDVLTRVDLNEKKKWIHKAGAVLSDIHRVHPKRFGWIDGEGVGEHEKWSNFVQGEYKKRDRIIEKAKILDITSKEIDLTFSILSDHESLYEKVTPHLLHGDFGPKHLFVTGSEITGVIDMEHAMSGDPINDFAWWDYFRGSSLPLEWLKEGYKDKEIFNNSFDLRLHLYRLALSLSLFQYYSTDNNVAGMNKTKGSFFSDLEYFKLH